jgi:hypothetical protein
MYKLKQIAKVVKGNKKDFKPNELTKALAEFEAKKDIKKDKKKNLKSKL